LVSQDRTRVKMMHSAAVAVAECVDVRYMLGDRQTDRQTDGQTPDHFIDPAVHTTRRTVVVLLVVGNKTEGIRQSSYIHRA